MIVAISFMSAFRTGASPAHTHTHTAQHAPSTRAPLAARTSLRLQFCGSLELRNNMTLIKEDGLTSLKTRVNLGCDFFVNAKVPDTSSVYVNVGLGFHAEMTIDEAIAFSTAQEAQLSGAADELTDQVVELKARIKLVARALNELGTMAR